jgi:hypothetical protein
MSRGQEGAIIGTTTGENATENAASNAGFGAATGDIAAEQGSIANEQGDIGNFASQLGKFGAANPYVQGGEMATTQNQSLADTANAGANATAQALQSAAVHGGANPAQAIAASEEVAQQNQRTLGGQEAAANESRIGSEAGYNEKTLAGYQAIPGMQGQVTGSLGNVVSQQGQLANEQGELANAAEGIAAKEAETPSFLDTLGSSFASSLGKWAGGGGCWIAAELWGGWDDERVKLVRLWLWNDFNRSWYGWLLVKAYGRYGERLAKVIHWPQSGWPGTPRWQRRLLRAFFGWLFGRALIAARRWEQWQFDTFRQNLYGGKRGPGMAAEGRAGVR